MKKKSLLSVLAGAVALCSVGALVACGDDEAAPSVTPTPSYNPNTTITDVADVEYTYDADGVVESWTQKGKRYEARYLLNDESAAYVELAGEKPEEMEIVGYHGAIETLSLEDIENAVKIDNCAISVIGIKAETFKGCSTLKTVNLTKKNKALSFNIGERAFYNCSALTSITFPDAVYSAGNEIGESAFAGCSALTSVSIPAAFNKIGDGAFANCIELASVTLPDTLEILPTYLFAMDDKLASFTGARNVKSIQEYAFAGTRLSSFNFASYTKLTYIGDYAFAATSLTQVAVPQSVGYIGTRAFYDLKELTSIEIPFLGTSVVNSYGWTYEHNYGLASDTDEREITVSVTAAIDIGNDVFAQSESVTSITIESYIAEGRYNIYDDEGLVSSRLEVEPTYTIGNRAFLNCHNLTSLTLPEGVTNIGEYAFQNCYNMETVALQEGLETIGKYAFNNCRALTAVTLPSTVTAIGVEAFYGCRELTSITFPASVKYIGNAVLGDCASLQSVTVEKAWDILTADNDDGTVSYESNALTLGREWFSRVAPSSFIEDDEMYSTAESNGYYIPASLRSVVVRNVKDIPAYAFQGFKELTSVTLAFVSESNVPAAYKAYYYRQNGTPYTFTSAVGTNAFKDCRKVTAIALPNTVTSIGDNAFYGCRSLTSFNIPSSITSASALGSAMLGDCVALTTLTVGKWDGLVAYTINNSGYTRTVNQYYTLGSLNKLFSASSDYLNEQQAELGDEYYFDNQSLYRAEGASSYSNNVYLPKTLTTVNVSNVCQVPEYAFNGWSYLRTVSLNYTGNAYYASYDDETYSQKIGNYAFYNCSNLSALTAANVNTVSTIGDYAFYGCSSYTGNVFTTFTAVESIGRYALANSTYNGAITLPATLNSVGSYLLNSCYNVTSLTIENYNNTLMTSSGYNGIVKNLFTSSTMSTDYYNLGEVTLKNVESFVSGAMQNMATVTVLNVNPDDASSSVYLNYNNNIFRGMSSLQTLNFTIPYSCYTDSSYYGILNGCTSLRSLSVTLPSTSYNTTTYRLANLFTTSTASSNSSLPSSLETVRLVTSSSTSSYIPANFLYNASYVTSVEFNGAQISGIGQTAFSDSGVYANCYNETTVDGVTAAYYMLNGWMIGRNSNYALYIPASAYGVANGVLPTSSSSYTYNRVYFEGTRTEWSSFPLSGSYMNSTSNLYVYQNNAWVVYTNA